MLYTVTDNVGYCSCDCNEGFVDVNDECVEDDRCTATMETCVEFENCIDPFGDLNVVARGDCTTTDCTACTDDTCATEVNANGDGRQVQCPSGSYSLQNNGQGKY